MTAAITRQHAGHWSSRREPTEAADTAYAEPLALPPTKPERLMHGAVWCSVFVVMVLMAVAIGAAVIHIARN